MEPKVGFNSHGSMEYNSVVKARSQFYFPKKETKHEKALLLPSISLHTLSLHSSAVLRLRS